MGGEKDLPICEDDFLEGSPRHGWGRDLHQVGIPVIPGITPAWAGKSLFCFTAAVPIQDHPRVGGEKAMDAIRQQ